jgi:hypothetical protein
MIHNGSLKVGDFGSAGCASMSAAALASSLQKQAMQAMRKTALLEQQPADSQTGDQLDQQSLLLELEQLQHQQHHTQLHLQADCTADAQVKVNGCAAAQQEQHHAAVPRFGVAADAVAGTLSPGVSGRLSVQMVKDAMNFRIGSIEYMAPEMLNKPTAAEVFHLVGS